MSRVVWSADGKPARQEIFCATGEIRREYLSDLDDPAAQPQNQDPKLLVYDVTAGGSLRDRFSLALPRLAGGGSAANIVFSPCRQFLVVLQAGGVSHTCSVAQRRFVDGVVLRSSAGAPILPQELSRPAEYLWTAPHGQAFFSAALDEPLDSVKNPKSTSTFRTPSHDRILA